MTQPLYRRNNVFVGALVWFAVGSSIHRHGNRCRAANGSAGDSFYDDYVRQPWKLVPAYNVGNLAYKLFANEKIAPHEVLSAVPIGAAAVAVAGERNADRFVYDANADALRALGQFVIDHPCSDFLAHLSPTAQFVCHPYAFDFRTFEDVELPLLAGCIGLDVGSLLAPIIVDLGTMPLQVACSEWYDYRIDLYAHLKGVPPGEYEFLLDLPAAYGGDDDGDGYVIGGGNDNSTRRRRRRRRGISGTAFKKAAQHSILKIIRPDKIFSAALTTYAKTFKGPTGKVLSDTALDVIKNTLRTERVALDPMFKITQSKLRTMVRKYLLMPDVVARTIDESRFLTKPEKINLVQEAIAKYKPQHFYQ